MRHPLLLILLSVMLLSPMVMADDYVDDVYFWRSVTETKKLSVTETKTRSVTETKAVADTIWEQPADTVVRMTIRR